MITNMYIYISELSEAAQILVVKKMSCADFRGIKSVHCFFEE